MLTRVLFAILLTAALAGCNFDDSSDTSAPASGGTATGTSKPVIQGSPAASVAAGAQYSFVPVAKTSTGSTLQFSIQNKPSWASFSAATGALSGRPSAQQVGLYAGIVISASDGTDSAVLPAFAVTVTESGAPSISGTPVNSVAVGSEYSFTPAASAANGEALSFSIANKPSWASFDESTGELSGTPEAGDVGTTSGITISVSDGAQSSSLPAFAISVSQAGSDSGSATLSWTPPQQNTDGTPLTNLAGYHLYYGTNSSSLSKSIKISNSGVSTYVITDLSKGTWYFSVKAYNSKNVESDFSARVSKTIS